MKCQSCNCDIEDGVWEYCPNCKSKIINTNLGTEKVNSALYILAFITSLVLMFAFPELALIFFILALISIVTGYIKCKGVVIKVVFWCFLVTIIITPILGAMLLFWACNSLSPSCPG